MTNSNPIPDSSGELIMEEARKRGIHVTSFPEINKNFALLTHQDNREFIFFSSTDRLSRVVHQLLLNKPLTNRFLAVDDFPIAEDIMTSDLEEAKKFLAKHDKVVVKPHNLTWGKGVTPAITTEEQLEAAWQKALDIANSDKLVCQKHVEGVEYRVLVIDYQEIFVVRRLPARVIGDGEHNIKELVEINNETTTGDYGIKIDDAVIQLLEVNDLSVDSVPEKDQVVPLRLTANIHAGGTVEDATAETGENVKRTAIDVAKFFKSSMIGIDIITPDVTKDFGVVIELNSNPDLRIHSHPTRGDSRNPAVAVVDMLFPETKEK